MSHADTYCQAHQNAGNGYSRYQARPAVIYALPLQCASLHNQRWRRNIRAGWIISSNLTLAVTVYSAHWFSVGNGKSRTADGGLLP